MGAGIFLIAVIADAMYQASIFLLLVIARVFIVVKKTGSVYD
jgi:hypothetical protein